MLWSSYVSNCIVSEHSLQKGLDELLFLAAGLCSLGPDVALREAKDLQAFANSLER